MKSLNILEHEVILQNLGPGQGKIIIASQYLNTSYYWGSMGSTLEEFICDIDLYYFTNKLLPHNVSRPIDSKKTFAAFRRQLFEENLHCYPWYKYKEFHKVLREKIKSIQGDVYSEYEFIDSICFLPKAMDYYEIEDRNDRERIESILKEACSEPWHYIKQGVSREEKMLAKIFVALRKQLKKELQTA